MDNDLIEVIHVPGTEHRADILTKALGRIRYKEMRSLIGVEDLSNGKFKFGGGGGCRINLERKENLR